MAIENYNSIIIEVLGAKPIAFNPVLAEITDSATAGLFMSQLLYWYSKAADEWMYKTIEDVKQETRMKRSEQDSAIREWKRLGVIEVKLKGQPPKRHFKINVPVLIDILDQQFNLQNPANSNVESSKLKSDIQQNIYTENTTENTTDIREGAIAPTPADVMRKFIEDGNYRDEVAAKVAAKSSDPGGAILFVREEFKNFIDYWTEPTKSGRKQKWETMPTFELGRRLATWFRNADRFNKYKVETKGVSI